MVCQAAPIMSDSRCFAHQDAYALFNSTLASARLREHGATVIIDMSQVEEVTTSAFARLVLLRRELRRQGKDLKLTGLRLRAEKVYEVNRLSTVLPRC